VHATRELFLITSRHSVPTSVRLGSIPGACSCCQTKNYSFQRRNVSRRFERPRGRCRGVHRWMRASLAVIQTRCTEVRRPATDALLSRATCKNVHVDFAISHTTHARSAVFHTSCVAALNCSLTRRRRQKIFTFAQRMTSSHLA